MCCSSKPGETLQAIAQGEGTPKEPSSLAKFMIQNSKSEEAKVARVCQAAHQKKRQRENTLCRCAEGFFESLAKD